MIRLVGGFVVANLLLRLALVPVGIAEYTDGLDMLTGAGWRQPIYPHAARAAAHLIGDPVLGGRLVAAVAGALTVWPVCELARTVYGRRAALLAGALFTCSALSLRWSVRVMTESTFELTGLFATLYLARAFLTDSRWSLALATAFSGLALLTRPDAVLFLLPLGAVLVHHALVRARRTDCVRAITGLLPWFLYLLWKRNNAGASYFTQQEHHLQILTWSSFLTYFATYAVLLVHVVAVPVFACAVYGALKTWKAGGRARLWLALWAYLLVAKVAGISTFAVFSGRFLCFAAPLVVIEAAHGIDVLLAHSVRAGRAAIATALAWSTALCVLAVYGSYDAFGDLKRLGDHVKEHYPRQVLQTDDIWVKTAFYSRARVKKYAGARTKAGSLVALHSFYTPLDQELANLSRKHKVTLLYEATSKVMPILGDEIMSTVRLTHSAAREPSQLLRMHSFRSVLVRVDALPSPG